MSHPFAHIFKNVFQVAYVADDLERATRWFRDNMDTPEWTFISGMRAVDCVVDGEPAPLWEIDVAVVNVGTTNIEIIRPVAGPVGMYADHIDSSKPATFHHLGMLVEDMEETTASLEAYGKRWTTAFESPGFGLVAYADFSRELGHYVEALQLAPEGKEFFADLAKKSGY
ncbi:VOC family protein [Microbacterium foliorum]|uniref:VOC family protein n=1 Tax=Microbacterium TaxID=33882 RepID=UPI0020A1B989|nr:VOC family protein [Microbacterium foliorum]MCP1430701.1 catechol 2,3-dioxygenase-like lactoylglutathione lyase family enzyme [Microbacterium foliorum]